MVQPEGLQASRQDDRHPVMDGAEQVVGCRGDDGARADDVAFWKEARLVSPFFTVRAI